MGCFILQSENHQTSSWVLIQNIFNESRHLGILYAESKAAALPSSQVNPGSWAGRHLDFDLVVDLT